MDDSLEFDESVTDLLTELESECQKKGLWFDASELYWSLERDTQLSIPASKLCIIDSEIELQYKLPWKFGVYRNYLGWWMSGGIGKSEIDTWDEKIDAILDECQILFWTCLENIEKLAFEPQTERWADRFWEGYRIH